jgi:xylulose-5-phosphate/fructose-6-phosphate phosphoketolase
MDAAVAHVERGIGALDWAGTDGDPDVVLAAAGDVPTTEVIAAADLLRTVAPDVAVRVVNVVDLFRLQPPDLHPHGLPDVDFDAVFPPRTPIVFAYHGYPWTIHRLAYRRAAHADLHVHGYRERGTTTTPFDMLMLNDLDRYALASDALQRLPGGGERFADAIDDLAGRRERARAHTREFGVDHPDITEWRLRDEPR